MFISAGLDQQILTWDIRTGTVPTAQFTGPDQICEMQLDCTRPDVLQADARVSKSKRKLS